MDRVLRFSLVLEFSLVLLEIGFHPSWLPLGGRHEAQIALVIGAAAALLEFADIFAIACRGRGKTSHSTAMQKGRAFESASTHEAMCVGQDRRSGKDRRRDGHGGRRVGDLTEGVAGVFRDA